MKAGLLAAMLALFPASAWALDGQVLGIAYAVSGIGQIDNSTVALIAVLTGGMTITAPLVPGLLGN